MLLNPLVFHAPKTLSELTQLCSDLDNFRLQAGGTFLLNALKLLKRNGAKTPEHVISLTHISDLKGIRVDQDQLVIGSMTTIDEIFDSALVSEHLPVLKQVCRNISTQPIRNMATIGGNLTCRYTWTEMPAVCIGLDAKLHFATLDGNMQEVDPAEFFKQGAKTDHILKEIAFPLDSAAVVSYQRVKKTQYVDIPMLSLIVRTTGTSKQFTHARVAVNNCVEFAQRDAKLEEFLNGTPISKNLSTEAIAHLDDEIYDKRGNDYKRHMFELSLQYAIQEICKHYEAA